MSEISATSTSTSRISEILRQHDQGILSEWTKHQLSESGLRPGLEEVIARQQQELLELSKPVVKLREGVLALPLIGTLDSLRTQVVMENLREQIANTSASLAIMTSPASHGGHASLS